MLTIAAATFTLAALTIVCAVAARAQTTIPDKSKAVQQAPCQAQSASFQNP